MRRQRGQSLVFVLALLAALLASLFLVFDSGQIVSDKQRLQNTADAAAFSAALWEARSLNFQAYMNRAIVANEAAIAQLVSLRSWSAYMKRTLANSSTVTSWIPYVNAAMRLLSQAWERLDLLLQKTLPSAEAALSHWNVDALANAEVLAHQQALITAGEIAADVVKQNLPAAEMTTGSRILAVRNAGGWQRELTDIYRPGSAGIGRLRALVMQARDGFTAERNWTPLDASVASVRKRGGTDLIGDYVWRGVDTLGVHVDLGFASSEVPVGWGSAENRRLPDNRRGQHGGTYRSNRRTSRLADRARVVANGYRGLPEAREIHRPTVQEDLTLDYVVSLRKRADSVATTATAVPGSHVMLPDGRELQVEPNLSAEALHALGAARIHYRRPAERGDGRAEFPNLLNPYWQVRLVPAGADERLLTSADRGLRVDPYAVLER